jgi:hypothetical protein
MSVKSVINSLIKEIDDSFGICDESSANAILMISSSPNSEVLYKHVFNQNMNPKLKPIIKKHAEFLNTENGHKCMMKLISKSHLTQYNDDKTQLLNDFPSVKKFVDYVKSNNKEEIHKLLTPRGLLQLYLSLSKPNFDDIFVEMQLDDKLRYETRKKIQEFQKKNKSTLSDEEMTKLVKVMFNL